MQARPVKALLAGRPGTGKTAAVASLVKAGFEVFVIDLDNNLRSLSAMLEPAERKRVRAVTLTDARKAGASPGVMGFDGSPSSFPKALRLLTRWKEGDQDFGEPSEWGPNRVIVIDSISRLGDYAMNHVIINNKGNLIQPAQQHWLFAQRQMEDLVSMLNSDEFNCNVLALCHIKSIEEKGDDGKVTAARELPMGVGTAGSEKLGSFWDTIIQAERSGVGGSIKYELWVKPPGLLETKLPVITPDRKFPNTELHKIFELLGVKPS